MFRRYALSFALAIAAACSIAACSGGGSSGPTAGSVAIPAASPGDTTSLEAVLPGHCPDCWPTFAHDVSRASRFDRTSSIASGTVARLAVVWSYGVAHETTASPIIGNGAVYVAANSGDVYSFSLADGTINWTVHLGRAITQTPTVDGNILIVATHDRPGTLYALNALTGAQLWQQSVSGTLRSAAAVFGHTVYVGEGGGDPGVCVRGGVRAFQEETGAPLWTWHVNAIANDGGSVWAPITFDGSNLVFGTGNGCSLGIANANDVVRLGTDGTYDWTTPKIVDSFVDDDWGGAIMSAKGAYFGANKNGSFYRIDSASGALVWTSTLSTVDAQGSIGSPATDGSVLVVPTGFTSANNGPDPASGVVGLSLAGARLWNIATHDDFPGAPAIVNDLAFLSLDGMTAAVKTSTGTTLWSYVPPGDPDYFYASPAVSSTRVVAVDVAGNVYAFGLPSSVASARVRAVRRTAEPIELVRTRAGILRMRY